MRVFGVWTAGVVSFAVVLALCPAARAQSGQVIDVPWSADPAMNAANIESALNTPGTDLTVRLEAKTYQVDRLILALGFDGTLTGVDVDVSAIEAVGAGSYKSPWLPPWAGPIRSVLFFDFATNLTIKDLTIKARGDIAVEQLVDIIGGEGDLVLRNLRVLGEEDTSYGNGSGGRYQRYNVHWGVHIMRGPGFTDLPTSGACLTKALCNVTVESCHLENIGDYGLLVMTIRDSDIRIGGHAHKAVTLKNVGTGISLNEFTNCNAEISHVSWENTSSDGWTGITVESVESSVAHISDCSFVGFSWIGQLALGRGAEVVAKKNTFKDFTTTAVEFRGDVHNSLIHNNTFINSVDGNPAIYFRGYGEGWYLDCENGWQYGYTGPCTGNVILGNKFKQSNLPGFDVGNGCIIIEENWVDPADSNTGNSVIGGQYPQGTNVCTQVFDEHQGTYIPGSASCIHNPHRTSDYVLPYGQEEHEKHNPGRDSS